MRAASLAKHIGLSTAILVEGRYGATAGGDWFGYTPHYLPVRLPPLSSEDLTNRLVQVELVASDEEATNLMAKLLASDGK